MSLHFTEARAHQAATARTLATRKQGRSSGWGKVFYVVRKRPGLRLRRYEVTP